jgi:hypothetical protein
MARVKFFVREWTKPDHTEATEVETDQIIVRFPKLMDKAAAIARARGFQI